MKEIIESNVRKFPAYDASVHGRPTEERQSEKGRQEMPLSIQGEESYGRMRGALKDRCRRIDSGEMTAESLEAWRDPRLMVKQFELTATLLDIVERLGRRISILEDEQAGLMAHLARNGLMPAAPEDFELDADEPIAGRPVSKSAKPLSRRTGHLRLVR